MDLTHPSRSVRAAALCPFFALLVAASASAEDEPGGGDDDTADEGAIEVPVVVEAAEIEVQPGHVRFDAGFIEGMPTNEATLADVLRANPAVDFSRESQLSANSAVLRPAEISIHGQPFYQNAFLIDGMDATNDLNPGAAEDIWSTPSLVQPHGGSSPQGYYVDTNLIESVEVYDSNIPAEYGGFLGGVVGIELKRYSGEDLIAVAYGLGRDEWEQFHVSEDDLTAADYYRAAFTPDYRKSRLGVGVLQGIGELGLAMSISRQQSTFAQRYEKRYHIDRQEEQRLEYDDTIDNVLGRVDTELGSTALGLSFRHARRRHDGLTSTTYDGRFEQDHDGNGVTLEIERPIGQGKLELGVGLDRLEDILDSDSNLFAFHEYAEGSATEAQYYGAFGDSHQSQTRMSITPKWTLAPHRIGEVEHEIVLGSQLTLTDSYYKRSADVVFEQYWCVRDQGREGCQDQDGDGVSGPGDEYIARISNYYEGEVDLTYASAGVYAQSSMTLRRWVFEPGLRIDWNDYLGNVDVSPRVSMQWDAFDNDRTILVAGVNRYYGRSFFRYQLNDAISGWRDSTQFNANGSVRRVLTYDDRSGRSDLSTPYSDEWMVGWTQAIGKSTLRTQFVNRERRDGVSRERLCLDPDDSRCREYTYVYANKGRSSVQSVGMRLESVEAMRFGPTATTFTLSLSYRNATSNSQDNDAYDDPIEQDLIYYDGSLRTVDELPAWDYNVPFGTSFNAKTFVPGWNVVWSNFVNVRRGGTIARDSGLDCDDEEIDYCEGSYDIYEEHDFDGLVTLDTGVTWRPKLVRDVRGALGFVVQNVFDDTIDTNTSRLSDRRRLTTGRVFSIKLGMVF